MNTRTLPVFSQTFTAQFPDNRAKFRKLYTVRVSFRRPIYSVEEAHNLISEWIHHHKRCFFYVWLQPELCPSSRRVHYHGIVEIKDIRAFNRSFLKLFEEVGQFHIEVLKGPLLNYINYCTKDVGVTECCDHSYRRHILKKSDDFTTSHQAVPNEV